MPSYLHQIREQLLDLLSKAVPLLPGVKIDLIRFDWRFDDDSTVIRIESKRQTGRTPQQAADPETVRRVIEGA